MSSRLTTSTAFLFIAIACSALTIFGAAEAGTKKVYSGATANSKLPKVMALTSSDCRKVDGKVIEVADSRCGGSHQYCKLSNGNAVCIDKRD